MKKKMKNFKFAMFALICLALSFTSCTIKETKENLRTVEVSGVGEVQVKNDIVSIELSVITRNSDITRASSENAQKMTSVQNALSENGISKNNISTSGYSVYQEKNYQNGRTILGLYNVTNKIKVVLNDVSKVGEIIDLAIKSGANELDSVNYSVSNTNSALKQARILAVKQAEEKANTIATSSGNILGQVLKISESTSNFSDYENSSVGALKTYSDSATTPISSGKSTVQVKVNATYELK